MKNRNLIILVIFYALILILIGILQPHEIDWHPTFAARDKIPYGTYILKETLGDLFPGSEIKTTSESIYKTLHNKNFTHTNYILVENEMDAGRGDIKELLRFAGDGNNVFIAARQFPFRLMDTLGIFPKYAMPQFFKNLSKTDTLTTFPLSLLSPAFSHDSVYDFEINNIPFYFSRGYISYREDYTDSTAMDTTRKGLAEQAIVISTMSHTRPVYIKVPIGKGNIYLHSYPFAFSNYYLIKDTTRDYAEKCLSYLPKGDILWDEHYKTDPQYRHISTMSFILTSDPLRWAYYTGAVFLIIFVLFSIKRRQRIIPVVAPFRNSTLEFTETVGRLYFNRGDHKNIAEKKIRHLLEYIRSRYYVDTQELDEDFITKLSAKSGLEHDRIKYMTEVIRSMLKKKSIADPELIQLNELIEYFKKYSI